MEELAMSSRLLTCLFAATTLIWVGCDDSTGLDDDEAANVRIINASPAVGELDVLVNGNVQANASDVAFRAASAQCVRVDADNPGLTFQQTAGTVAIPATTFTFDNGGRNTVVVAGTSGTNLRVVTFSEAPTTALDANEARIRVVNGRATTAMNVTVTPWDQPMGTPQTISASTNPATAATAWVDVPAGEPVAVRLTTTAGAFIDALNLFPNPGQEFVVVAAESAAGQPEPVQWIVTQACARP
jgi:hypothetical protein